MSSRSSSPGLCLTLPLLSILLIGQCELVGISAVLLSNNNMLVLIGCVWACALDPPHHFFGLTSLKIALVNSPFSKNWAPGLLT